MRWLALALLFLSGAVSAQTAPTPPVGDCSNRIATTDFVCHAGGGGGVPSLPPGNYTCANITVNSSGFITAISSGNCGGGGGGGFALTSDGGFALTSDGGTVLLQ